MSPEPSITVAISCGRALLELDGLFNPAISIAIGVVAPVKPDRLLAERIDWRPGSVCLRAPAM